MTCDASVDRDRPSPGGAPGVHGKVADAFRTC
jgi:hypothetical protein